MTGYPNAGVVGVGDVARRGLSGTQADAVEAERGRREAEALRRRLLRKRLAGGRIDEADIAERDALTGANVDRARLERARERDALRAIDPEGQYQDANRARLRALAGVVREENEVAGALGPAQGARRQSPEEAAAAYRLSQQTPEQAGLARLLPGAATREVYAAAEAEEAAARGGAPAGGPDPVRDRLAYLRGQRERLSVAPDVRPYFASDEARAGFEAETPGALRQTVAGTLDARRRLLGETASRVAETERRTAVSRGGELQEEGRQAQLRLARSLGAEQAIGSEQEIQNRIGAERALGVAELDSAARAAGFGGAEQVVAAETEIRNSFNATTGAFGTPAAFFDSSRLEARVDTILSLPEPVRSQVATRIIRQLQLDGLGSEADIYSSGLIGPALFGDREVARRAYRKLVEASQSQ